MNQSTLNIGLFGFGCVGYGLYNVLQKSNGINANIVSVCVKNAYKERPIQSDIFTLNADDILLNPNINIVVELIDDADAAFAIVKKALQNGKAVVSANKKMIAEHFFELLELQKTYNLPVLYEAAACASIPIIRNLEEYYDNDTLNSFEGIVNGSTNYILTRSINENLSFESALKQAQLLGYAESNPSLDVDGYDAAYKLRLLCAHAFGVFPNEQDVLRIGISKINEKDIQYALEKGYKIKLIAKSEKQDEQLSVYVAPHFVEQSSNLYKVDDVFNGVVTETVFADKQFFAGRGAGAFPTASAVLSDISALSYQYKYEYKKLNRPHNLSLSNDRLVRAYIRLDKSLVDEIEHFFIQVEELHIRANDVVGIGDINLKTLQAIVNNYPSASVILLPISLEESKVINTQQKLAAV